MEDSAGEIIASALNQELGEDWRVLGELAKNADTEPKFHLVQSLFPDSDVTSWDLGETVNQLRATVWRELMADQLPPPVAQAIFQASLNLGVSLAVQLAQQAAGIEQTDGIMGPQTLEALNTIDSEAFLSNYLSILTQGTQATESTSTKAENFTQVLEAFNVEAVSKKSTSDVWTIEDQLGYQGYAQAIAKMIVDEKAEPPLTISIQAPWGQGKTSLMRMIKYRLEHGLDAQINKETRTASSQITIPGTQSRLHHLKRWMQEADDSDAMLTMHDGQLPCVWFNPLYFQNSDQVWSGLAHAILHQLADKLPSQLEKERFWFRLQMARLDTHAMRRDIHKLILERWLPKGLMWFGLLILTLLYSLTKTQLGEFLEHHTLLELSPLFGGLGHLLYDMLNKNKNWTLDDKLARHIKEPDYNKDMGLLHLVDHDLDRALKLLLGQDGRLVVFIDDLDRCTPETVNDILLAINQFISVQHRNLYFILGMDTHMVAMAIETAAQEQAETYNKNRHTSKGYGWRFMEKFVQLPFFIPRIQANEARNYLDNLLRETPLPKIEPEKMQDIKKRIDASSNMRELREVMSSVKQEYQAEFIPQLDASVASKMVEITSDETGETYNKLITAAMSDLELNPREMKRFLNVARLLFIRLDHNEDVSSDEHMLKVVRASHLILNWSQCLRWLQGNANSYTVKGDKLDPVESLENLFNNPGIDNFQKWRQAITDTWGETVAETIAQPDFYTFARRIHDNPPNLQDIFKARIF